MANLPVNTRRVARAAGRRAMAASLLGLVAIALAVGGVVDGVLIVCARFVWIRLPGQTWMVLLIAAPIVAVAAAVVVAWARRWSLMRSACVLDEKLALKDRLSTALALAGGAGGGGLFAPIAIADAERLASSVSVGSAIPIRFGRAWFAALAAGGAAVGAWFIPQRVDEVGAAMRQEQAARVEAGSAVTAAAETARKAIESSGLEESRAALAQRQLAELDKITEELASKGAKKKPEEALAESSRSINQVAEELSRRSTEEMERVQEARRQLAKAARTRGVPEGESSPAAEEFRKAMREGDVEGAQTAARKLASELESLPEEQREALAEDLEKMAEEMERSSGAEESAGGSEASKSEALKGDGRGAKKDGEVNPPSTQGKDQVRSDTEGASKQGAKPEAEEGTAPKEGEKAGDAVKPPGETGPSKSEQKRETQAGDEEKDQNKGATRETPSEKSPAGATKESERREGEGSSKPAADSKKEEKGSRSGEDSKGSSAGDSKEQKESKTAKEQDGGEERPGEKGAKPNSKDGEGTSKEAPAQRLGRAMREAAEEIREKQGAEKGGAREGEKGTQGKKEEGDPTGKQGDGARGEDRTGDGAKKQDAPGEGAKPSEGEKSGEKQGAEEGAKEGEKPAEQKSDKNEGPGKLPDSLPDAKGLERLAREFERLQKEGKDAQKQGEISENLKRQAEELLRKASPEQRRELERLAREMARKQGEKEGRQEDQKEGQKEGQKKGQTQGEQGGEQGRREEGQSQGQDRGNGQGKGQGDRPDASAKGEKGVADGRRGSAGDRSGGGGDSDVPGEGLGERKKGEGPADGAFTTNDQKGQDLDARRPSAGEGGEEPIAEIPKVLGDMPGGRAPVGLSRATAREAARGVERALEQETIPQRHSDLIRRVFRRMLERTEAPGPKSAEQKDSRPAPAPDAVDAPRR